MGRMAWDDGELKLAIGTYNTLLKGSVSLKSRNAMDMNRISVFLRASFARNVST